MQCGWRLRTQALPSRSTEGAVVLTGVYPHVDPLTAVLYPAFTKPCEVCGGFMVTTPQDTVKRYATAAAEPLAKFGQELESDFVGQFENLVSQSVVDRVERYRDVLGHVA